MKYHPDRTQGDKGMEEKFKEIEAVEVLTDDQTRRMTSMVTMPSIKPGALWEYTADFRDIFGDVLVIFLVVAEVVVVHVLSGSDLRYNLIYHWKRQFAKDIEIQVPTLVSCETCEALVQAGTSPRLNDLSRQWHTNASGFLCSTNPSMCGGKGKVM